MKIRPPRKPQTKAEIEDDPPPRRRRHETPSQRSSKQKSGNPMLLWGLIGGGVALAAIGVAMFVLMGGDPEPSDQHSKNDPNVNRDQTRDVVLPKKKQNQPKDDIPKKQEPLPKPKPKPKDEPEVVGKWEVSVDPPVAAWSLPDGKAPPIQLRENPVVSFDMFSRINSPYMTMFKNFLGSQHVRVFNMRDGKKLGDFPVKGMHAANFSPSPDGKHVLTIQSNPLQGMIHSVADGKTVATFPLNGKNGQFVDFLDPNRVLLLVVGDEKGYTIDAKTGKTDKTFDLGFPLGFRDHRYALSPGGNFAAILDTTVKNGWQIRFFDLRKAAPAGSVFLPIGNFRGHFGFAFSPDGKEFACLLGDDRVRVWSCDVATGKRSDYVEAPKSDKRNVGNLHDHVRRSYRGQPLLFTPDGLGWLIRGHLFLNRKTGDLTWAVPYSGISGNTGPYRFVGGDLLMVGHDRQAIPAAQGKSFWVINWPSK